jgi:hypothetical protein
MMSIPDRADGSSSVEVEVLGLVGEDVLEPIENPSAKLQKCRPDTSPAPAL